MGGRTCGRKVAVEEAWGPKRALQLVEGETGGLRGRKKGPKVCGLLGSLRGVWATERRVKVSAQNGRTLWGCGRDKEKGRGGPSVSTLLFAGAGGESWQDHAFRNAFPGSGGQTFSMVNLDGECHDSSRKINCQASPQPPWVQKKHSFGMLSSSRL